ncbi:MAG: ArsR/SmtB family transcription factor [Halanaerobiaceae bacterium]
MDNFTDVIEDYNYKAEILKALGHPVRLCIVRGLLQEEGCNVSKMQDCLDIPQSTLSQHLARLRNLGLIRGERDGVRKNYYVTSREAEEIIRVLFPEKES